MAGAKREPWTVGKRCVRYVRCDAAGEPTYVIRKMVGGHRYTVSTRKHEEEAARLELLAFEQDPAGYEPDRRPKWKEPVRLDLGGLGRLVPHPRVLGLEPQARRRGRRRQLRDLGSRSETLP